MRISLPGFSITSNKSSSKRLCGKTSSPELFSRLRAGINLKSPSKIAFPSVILCSHVRPASAGNLLLSFLPLWISDNFGGVAIFVTASSSLMHQSWASFLIHCKLSWNFDIAVTSRRPWLISWIKALVRPSIVSAWPISDLWLLCWLQISTAPATFASLSTNIIILVTFKFGLSLESLKPLGSSVNVILPSHVLSTCSASLCSPTRYIGTPFKHSKRFLRPSSSRGCCTPLSSSAFPLSSENSFLTMRGSAPPSSIMHLDTNEKNLLSVSALLVFLQ